MTADTSWQGQSEQREAAMDAVRRTLAQPGAFVLAAYFAITFRAGGLWRGLEPALAVTASATFRNTACAMSRASSALRRIQNAAL